MLTEYFRRSYMRNPELSVDDVLTVNNLTFASISKILLTITMMLCLVNFGINPKFLPVTDKFYLTLTCDRQGFAWTCMYVFASYVRQLTTFVSSCLLDIHCSCQQCWFKRTLTSQYRSSTTSACTSSHSCNWNRWKSDFTTSRLMKK